MSHTYATTILVFALTMFGFTPLRGFVPGALAQGSDDSPVSVGVVATVTGIDAASDTATLRTQAGEVFELPQAARWHVGHQVLCDRIGQSFSSRARFQNCRIWESAKEHESAGQDRPTSRR